MFERDPRFITAHMQLLKSAGISARVEDGAFIFELLSAIGITDHTKAIEVAELIDAVVGFLAQVGAYLSYMCFTSAYTSNALSRRSDKRPVQRLLGANAAALPWKT